ncbi:MAG: ABC transporter ATP-binding protein [Oligoflexia bacterium]|nr:ABC transporter ATP-binding protein [Oligoflexia bacterium]
MIKISDMSYSIAQKSPNILTDINLDVSKGDFIGVLGKNGAGKTTLLDLMMGFRRPCKGSISILNQDPFTSDRSVFTEISYLSQDILLKDNISIESFLSFHSHFYSNYSKKHQNMLIDLFKLDLKSKIGGLSTGEKRRAQIIAAIASMPKILIIDEITAVLDPDARMLFFNILKEINTTQSTTIILATNIVEDLKNRVNSVLFINNTKMENCEASKISVLFTGGNE